MKKIGITGTIASGKTSVSILLKRHGFAVFNADQYARMCTHNGNVICEQLKKQLPAELTDAQGSIDRKKLAELIFHDEDARKLVNSLTHPYVREGMHKFFASHGDEALVFAEVPLLFEAGMEEDFDLILVVTCSKETAVKRMMEDRDYTEEEAIARYDSQIDPQKQIERADEVIYNDGTLQQLNTAVNRFLREMR